MLRSHVYEDVESPGAFYLISHWSSREALERHLGGPEFGIMLGALELLARPPLVVVTELADESEQEGFLRVRRLRDRIRRAGQHDHVATTFIDGPPPRRSPLLTARQSDQTRDRRKKE